jgi:hypothetical protein
MRDSHRRRAIGPWMLVGGLLVAAVLVRVLVVAADEDASLATNRTAAPVERVSPGVADRATADDLPAAQVEPISRTLDAAPAGAEVPSAKRVAYTGQVVDTTGRPLVGAMVWLVPDAATLRLSGHPLGDAGLLNGIQASRVDLLEVMSPSSFVSTEAGDDGRFVIEAELWPPDSAPGPGARVHPELFARHAGHRPALHVCRESIDAGDTRPIDVGLLVLPPGVTVQGRVVNEMLAPFPGVEVTAAATLAHVAGDRAQSSLADFGRNFARTVAGADGRFRLDGLAESTDQPLRIGFDIPGYEEVRREVVAVAGETVELGDVRVDRGLAVSGRVVDERGYPLAEVPIRLTDEILERFDRAVHTVEIERLMVEYDDEVVGAHGSRAARYVETVSGPDGRFVIGGLDGRTEYTAMASMPGREPARAGRLLAGAPEFELRLVPRGRLELRLVEGYTNVPVRDATVRAFRRMLTSFPNPPELVEMPVERDAEEPSRFVVGEVCPAEIGVLVDSQRLGRSELITAGLPLGSKPAVRELAIGRGWTLSGLVVAADTGAPVAGATVQLTHEDRSGTGLDAPGELLTSEAGTFRFEGLPRGSWRLHVAAAGRVPLWKLLELGPGGVQSVVTLELTPAARLEGTVTVAGRGPAGGVTVSVQESVDAVKTVGWVQTSDDGHYSIQVPCGQWVVKFTKSGPSGSGTAVEHASVAVGQILTVNAELPAPARLSGLAMSAGQPLAEVWIAARGDGVQLSIVTDAEGRFEQDVAGCGELVLVGRSPRGGISEVTRVLVEPGGEAWAEVRFGGRTLTGQVLDAADESPIAMAGVVVLERRPAKNERAPEAGRVVSDAEGRFRMDDLGVGDFIVQASHPDYGSPVKQPLAIGPADRDPVITLKLSRAQRLTGVVRTHDGEPVRARLVVSAFRDSEGSPQDSCTTEADGSYRLMELPDGHYKVFVMPNMFDSHGFADRDDYERLARGFAYVEIEDGQDSQLDITLDPDGE